MKTISVVLALLGVGITLFLFTWFDACAIWVAVLSIGWGGFIVLLALQGLLFVLLGLAWSIVMPNVSRALLVWGRMVRDAATTCLPFSPVGGYVIGARAVTLGFGMHQGLERFLIWLLRQIGGLAFLINRLELFYNLLRSEEALAWPTAAAGTVVDVTAELFGQLLFALLGVAVLLLIRPGSGLAGPVAVVALGCTALLVIRVWHRNRIGHILQTLGSRLLGDHFASAEGMVVLQLQLRRLYDPRRIGLAALVHLSGWIATGVITWASLRLLGSSVDLSHAIALEALLDLLVAAAFVVPGAAGVQEAGYVGIGAIFGVPPDLALGASLLRRGKDLAWGVPILLAWQWNEVSVLRKSPSATL